VEQAIDSSGQPLSFIEVVSNRLLKILASKKFIPDSPLNGKLQSKKQVREQQKKDVMVWGENMPALFLFISFCQKIFCCQ
jgi:hypothetical protein